LGFDELSTYSPVDELTLSMKWAVDEMAVDESPPHQRISEIFFFVRKKIKRKKNLFPSSTILPRGLS
jgi:hypothetical protein